MDNRDQQISILEVLHRIKQKKITVLVSLAITFVIACIIILPVPRYYNSSVELAPELGLPTGSSGGLGAVASSLGLNMGQGNLTDAIGPEIYPELLKSNNFMMQLIHVQVKTQDGKITAPYYDYLLKYQKRNPVSDFWYSIIGVFKKKKPTMLAKEINPFHLTEQQDGIFAKMKNNISCSIDKKTNLITINVEDQDPLIAGTMAEVTSEKLQDFITNYRTSKARKDVEYYQKLTDKAKSVYEKARQLYGSYSDANMDVMLQSIKSKQEDLENDMQLKYNNYTQVNTQLLAAKAKVQERTPVVTVVKSATVPLKPSAPTRMIFISVILLMSFMLTTLYICRDMYMNLFK